MPTITNLADQYTRFMIEMFDERELIGFQTGFMAFFGNPASGGYTVFCPDQASVEIDIIRGNEKLAALIPRGKIGRSIGSKQRDLQVEKSTTNPRVFPLIEEDGNINCVDLLKRLPGEPPYNSSVTQKDRLRYRALKIHMESCRRIIRTFEYLASQSILTGKMPAILGTTNPNLEYDFYRNTDHIISVPVAWNNASAVILQDVDAACKLVDTHGHTKPNFIGIGSAAMDAFIKDSNVKEIADNRRFELIEVSTNNPVPPKFARFTDSGWTARGRLRTPSGYELWIFTYIETYENDIGESISYMPEDQAIIASINARCDRFFGPAEVLPLTSQRATFYMENFGFNIMAPMLPPNGESADGIITPLMFMPYAYGSNDFTTITHRVQAAPIFATTQTDAFVTLKDLIEP